jgi:hypothetical protein
MHIFLSCVRVCMCACCVRMRGRAQHQCEQAGVLCLLARMCLGCQTANLHACLLSSSVCLHVHAAHALVSVRNTCACRQVYFACLRTCVLGVKQQQCMNVCYLACVFACVHAARPCMSVRNTSVSRQVYFARLRACVFGVKQQICMHVC